MKLEQLEQFIKVIDFGSISKAAMKMHMAQSTLSTSLKKFEEELGCQLIERDSKGVSLTPKGVEVYNQGKNICEQIEDMKKTAMEGKVVAHDVIWDMVIEESIRKDDVINTLLGLIY